MKFRSHRLEIGGSKSVEVIGIPLLDERLGIHVLHRLVSKLGAMLSSVSYFTLLPSGFIANQPPAFIRGGLSFARWGTQVPAEELLAREVEEVLIFLATENFAFGQINESHVIVDPCFWAKALPANGETASIFFSAWHKDLEIFIPPELSTELKNEVLKLFTNAN